MAYILLRVIVITGFLEGEWQFENKVDQYIEQYLHEEHQNRFQVLL